MKRIAVIFAVAALSVTTSCQKIPNYIPDPLTPGYYMFNMATEQNYYSMLPVDMAFRFNALLSEAKKQGAGNLDNLIYDEGNVKHELFYVDTDEYPGREITITSGQDDTYVLTFEDAPYAGEFINGELHIYTNGKTLEELEQGETWEMIAMPNKKEEFAIYGHSGGPFLSSNDYWCFIAESSAMIISPGAGPYSWDISVSNSQVKYLDDNISSPYSSWDCYETLVLAAGADMSYSGLLDADLELSGYAWGTTLFSTKMRYDIDDAKPLVYVTGCAKKPGIISGAIEVSFTRYESEIDHDTYPADRVLIGITKTGNCSSESSITYNGVTDTY